MIKIEMSQEAMNWLAVYLMMALKTDVGSGELGEAGDEAMEVVLKGAGFDEGARRRLMSEVLR